MSAAIHLSQPGVDGSAWGATVTAAGGVYAVVRSAEDARAVIDRACGGGT